MKMQDLTLSSLKYLTLLIGCFVALIPLVVVFLAAFKTADEFASSGLFTPPENWLNVANFVKAFTQGNMLQGFINTTIILSISVAGTIIIGTMAAYALDRFDFKFKWAVIGLFLLATLVPGVTTQVATFQVVNGLGLFNS